MRIALLIIVILFGCLALTALDLRRENRRWKL